MSRLDWFEKMSSHFLRENSTSVEAYIDSISTLGIPLDLLALYVIARLYRFHFGLVLNRGQWCTSVTKEMHRCTFILLFQGPTEFVETCHTDAAERYLKSLVHSTKQGLMPSHCTDMKQVEQEDDVVFIEEHVGCTRKVKSEIKMELKLDKELSVVLKREPLLGFKPKKGNKASTFSTASKLVARAKKEVQIKEERQQQSQAITALIATRTLTAANITSKAMNNRMQAMACTLCGKECRSKRQMLKHIKEEHPGAKWPCEFCGKQYNSYNRKYKHEHSDHSKEKYLCSTCGRGFDYQSQLDMHTPTHDPSAKVYCENCGKGFATCHSITRHAQVHLGLTFSCDQCPKQFNMKEKLTRYFRGSHGAGYWSLCGDFHFQWPGKCTHHQEICDDCKELKKKETGPCFSRTKTFCLTTKFVYVTAKFSEIPCVLFSFMNR